MKNKFAFLNFAVSLVVLFAMLFQTVHSYEHVYRQITETHCDHSDSTSKNQITHSHSIDSDCSICHFAFSTFIPIDFYYAAFTNFTEATSCTFLYAAVSTTFFKGSLFALRAPPALL
ncbi:hypothetical protein [Flavobacterium geliluteum]|uniref:DUF2946 domain-containing protein n=1 Tax=Flavobacterium geliluteum TaxID=2816120 RepID=A0A940XGX7_9FLAO|nr:hypothetical protein [Flavobacterium geliluteum]MBP4139028.1 hypothetical protein [Flavobacterium geliluteum]